MDRPSLQIASLLASRLCHDLISPVGAICNGLEILEDEQDAEMRKTALSLIEASAQQMSARLEYARIAFGVAAAAGDNIELSEARRLIQGLLMGGKFTLEWSLDGPAEPKDRIKALLNVMQIAVDCIPRGGVLTVARASDGFRIEAQGLRSRLADDTRRALFEQVDFGAVDSRQIQPLFTQLLLREQNGKLAVEEQGEKVVLSIHLPPNR